MIDGQFTRSFLKLQIAPARAAERQKNEGTKQPDNRGIEQQKNGDTKELISKKNIGRNDPCPCGAVKPDGTSVKYKKCHGK